MSVKALFALTAIAVTSIVVAMVLNSARTVPPLPQLNDTWWGPKSTGKEDTSIKPFKIQVSDQALKDFQSRLSSARSFTKPLEGAAQEYGMNSNLLAEIVDFWKTKYNWREREQFLNQYPQFKVSVQGLNIHYIHIKPKPTKDVQVLPLLLLHGWPGSVREFYEMIPILTTPQKGRDFVFEVIAPSLPGFGFSDPAVRPGLGPAQMAVVFKNFMERLGFTKYYVQGGDVGAVIAQHFSTLFPEKTIAVHSNMCIVPTPLTNLKYFLYSFYPSLLGSELEVKKNFPISKKLYYMFLEMAYAHIQATKPDTIGIALKDSPVGLAAYILEKFTTWTNQDFKSRQDGGLLEKFTYTQLLDNVMIYWFSGSITTSLRVYSEILNKEQMDLQLESIPTAVPSACARFSNEIDYTPEAILKDKYLNLVQLSDLEGGHFAALEAPDALAEDIYNFIEKVLLK